MGYASNDVGQLFITIKNPKKNAIKFAEKLHAALKPDLARIDGYLLNRNDSVPVTMLGYKTDSVSLALIRKNITADSKVDRNGCLLVTLWPQLWVLCQALSAKFLINQSIRISWFCFDQGCSCILRWSSSR